MKVYGDGRMICMRIDLLKLLDENSKHRSKFFYNIMPIENISSVVKNGILSYYNAMNIDHKSVALQPVQTRRENVIIPNGGKLHSYANLYFTYHNPMMYRRRNEANEFCVLAVNPSVLYFNGCILSDRNAAAELVRFYIPEIGLKEIDFDMIFAENWTDSNPYVQISKKSIKCAEILIPDRISYEYIVGAYVYNEKTKQGLLKSGFDKKVVINSKVFYR